MGDSSIVFDRTIQKVQDRLTLNSLNQKLITSNLANQNTPGYVAKATSFDSLLRESLEEETLRMVRSSSKHAEPGNLELAMTEPEIVETGPVDLDTEMLKLAQNSVEYQFMVSMLNKKFSMLRHAVDGVT